MRKKKCEVTDKAAIAKILERSTIGRFATNGADGYPYIVPLNFVFHAGSVYFHCGREGEKMDNLVRDPKVCFEVDIPLSYLDTAFDKEKPPCAVSMFYHSVIIRGRAKIIEDIDEKVAALNALMATHENVPGYSEITADMKAVDICAVVGIRIESISAKANLAQSQSEEGKQKIADYLEKRNLPGDREAAELIRPN